MVCLCFRLQKVSGGDQTWLGGQGSRPQFSFCTAYCIMDHTVSSWARQSWRCLCLLLMAKPFSQTPADVHTEAIWVPQVMLIHEIGLLKEKHFWKESVCRESPFIIITMIVTWQKNESHRSLSTSVSQVSFCKNHNSWRKNVGSAEHLLYSASYLLFLSVQAVWTLSWRWIKLCISAPCRNQAFLVLDFIWTVWCTAAQIANDTWHGFRYIPGLMELVRISLFLLLTVDLLLSVAEYLKEGLNYSLERF